MGEIINEQSIEEIDLEMLALSTNNRNAKYFSLIKLTKKSKIWFKNQHNILHNASSMSLNKTQEDSVYMNFMSQNQNKYSWDTINSTHFNYDAKKVIENITLGAG